ncbi:fungal-specific transcription factor domain-containing protein [Fusarium solani]|uniref:Fungal-specific transcription factor domain-containing protein n=1 Tax=Fusarium solani TaxID=169388 RepID=A0A9P9R7N8_FUSSL|nr:fungal-specific transcription factor domain-containing protein [Fusarium solani]KAH7268150.1 fungal-specific transcription factor domain-containing protein [Fusarium solani]
MAAGCWTCKDRKVRCDLRQPTCANCARSKRKCAGYGMRLSWPRPNDRRRSMVHEPGQSPRANPESEKALHFINTYTWHVAMYGPSSDGSYSNMRVDTKIPGADPPRPLMQVILQMALADSTPSSKAVLQGILALSSLRLSGNSAAFAHKTKAISALARSLSFDKTRELTSKTVVASMLLYLYETTHPSLTGPSWAVYLCGVKKIAKSSYTEQSPSRCMDHEPFFNWLHYHEIMGHFSLVWWAPPDPPPICFVDAAALLGLPRSEEADILRIQGGQLDAADTAQLLQTDEGPICSLAVLDIISLLFHSISPDVEHVISSKKRQRLLEAENSLRKYLLEYASTKSAYESCPPSNTSTLLHTIAALIFLNRAALDYSGEEAAHEVLVKRGLDVLDTLSVSFTLWPIFIIACEAHRDWARLLVLDVVARIEKHTGSRRLTLLRHLIEAAWNYHDLNLGRGSDYKVMLHRIIRTLPYMPFFA